MKKWVMFLVLLSVILVFILIWVINIGIKTGETNTVTGEVTESSFAVTISITGAPILTIIKPLNQTYFENESLRLKVNTNTNDMWYNLDNGANITFIDEVLFNTSEGGHTIYVFSNNSFGTTTKNVTFTINNTLYEIIHDEYKYTNRGDSTNFSEFSFTEIQNLSNIVLEYISYGKIIFNEAINITNDLNTSDSETNLDANINISSNRIELDSTALPNFNVPATLYLYNLTFSNPRILRDGSVCSSSICTQESYSGGTLKFNVTGFTVYSAEETPEVVEEAPPATPEVGGGLTFTISLDEIIISLKQGEIKTEEITIKNRKNTNLSFSLFSDMGELVKISEESFELAPKEEKTIMIDFIAKENTVPDLYLGNLFIEAQGIKKRILITMEIESREALFDVRLNIPEKYLQIYPGGELISETEIFNIVETGKVNVTIEYSIKNEQNIEIISEEEILSVDRSISFIKKFEMPENIEPGRYILYVRVTYDGKVASASSWFSVKKRFVLKTTQLYIIVGTLILIILIILIILSKIRKVKKHEESYRKIDKKFLAEKRLIKERT